jgi:hypothetical protein
MYASSSDRYDYRLRLQPAQRSKDAILLAYLRKNSHPYLDHHDMALMALRAFWLPIAYADHIEHGAKVSQQDFNQIVKISVSKLDEQASSLQEQFSLNRVG